MSYFGSLESHLSDSRLRCGSWSQSYLWSALSLLHTRSLQVWRGQVPKMTAPELLFSQPLDREGSGATLLIWTPWGPMCFWIENISGVLKGKIVTQNGNGENALTHPSSVGSGAAPHNQPHSSFFSKTRGSSVTRSASGPGGASCHFGWGFAAKSRQVKLYQQVSYEKSCQFSDALGFWNCRQGFLDLEEYLLHKVIVCWKHWMKNNGYEVLNTLLADTGDK